MTNKTVEQRFNAVAGELYTILTVNGAVTEVEVIRADGKKEFRNMATKDLNVDWMDAIKDTALPMIHGIPSKTWHSFYAMVLAIVHEPGDIFEEALKDNGVLIDMEKRLLKAAELFGHFLWINKVKWESPMGDIFISHDLDKEDDGYWLTRSWDYARVFNLYDLVEDWSKGILSDLDYYEHCDEAMSEESYDYCY